MSINYTKPLEIESGFIRGSFIHDDIASFKGIPYAAPPVGSFRFKEPVPHDKWDGVKDCTSFGKASIQRPIEDNPMWTTEFLVSNRELSEDSLTLNLWTNFSKKNMPVIVYFYGGGLVSGGSSCEIYDGTTLAENGVIYVTFNHREGTLGLFASEELSKESKTGTSGNYLLLDEIRAIKWVKDNIDKFGGDPNNITIMGQSSGSIGVSAISTSKIAKGLFKRVIAMGFNSYIKYGKTYISKEKSYDEGKRIMKEMGKTFEELKTARACDFVSETPIKNIAIDGYVIEKKFNKAVDDGDTNEYIYLMGSVAGDSMLQGICAEEFMQGREKVTTKDKLVELCKNFFKENYTEFEKMYEVNDSTFEILKKKVDEDFIISSMLYFKKKRIESKSKPTYIYYYTHVLPGPMADKFGAFHSAEVPYFFNVFSDYRKDYWKTEDKEFGKYLCNELAKFVKNDETSIFEKVSDDYHSYLRLDSDKKNMCEFPDDKYVLWEKAFEGGRE